MGSRGIKDQVAIVGMGCTAFGEHFDRSIDDMIIEAAHAAYDSAGISQDDVDAFWFGTLGSGTSGLTISKPLKIDYKPVTRVENMCATGSEAFRNAAYAVASGAFDLVVAIGAEKLKDETRQTWGERFGVRIFEGYGTTETAPVLAMNTPMQTRRGSVGRLMPGIDYRLESLPGIDEGGRLWVSGPNIMRGYLLADQPGRLQPPEDGWYDTGDVVEIDEGVRGVSLGSRFAHFHHDAGLRGDIHFLELGIVGGWLVAEMPEAVFVLPLVDIGLCAGSQAEGEDQRPCRDGFHVFPVAAISIR